MKHNLLIYIAMKHKSLQIELELFCYSMPIHHCFMYNLSEWLLFDAKWAIFEIFSSIMSLHDETK
jgi:hypothetical protein